MNEQLKQQAEKIFQEKYEEKFGIDSLSIMSGDFKELYDSVIIPCMIDALKTIVDPNVQVFKNWSDQMGKIHPNISGKNYQKAFKPISKIQPGQKLKDGDYVTDLTKYQREELMNIGGDGYVFISEPETLVFDGYGILYDDEHTWKTKYDFSDFKQLCENTFNQ